LSKAVRLLAILMSAAGSLAVCQLPEQTEAERNRIARYEERENLIRRAHKLEAEGKVSEAILVLRKAAVLDRIVGPGGDYGSATQMLARLLPIVGRPDEALALYRSMFYWDAALQDIRCSVGLVSVPAMDYAILLAARGRAQEAKEMYYAGLRHMNYRVADHMAPFYIAFDPLPHFTQWQYSPQRLEAAAKSIRARSVTCAGKAALLKRVRQLAPDWFLPLLLEAESLPPGDKRTTVMQAAKRLARSQLEREICAHFEAESDKPMYDVLRKAGLYSHDGWETVKVLKPNEQVLKKLVATSERS
jgi:tetratricopeptide (TPR) repeat protein